MFGPVFYKTLDHDSKHHKVAAGLIKIGRATIVSIAWERDKAVMAELLELVNTFVVKLPLARLDDEPLSGPIGSAAGTATASSGGPQKRAQERGRGRAGRGQSTPPKQVLEDVAYEMVRALLIHAVTFSTFNGMHYTATSATSSTVSTTNTSSSGSSGRDAGRQLSPARSPGRQKDAGALHGCDTSHVPVDNSATLSSLILAWLTTLCKTSPPLVCVNRALNEVVYTVNVPTVAPVSEADVAEWSKNNPLPSVALLGRAEDAGSRGRSSTRDVKGKDMGMGSGGAKAASTNARWATAAKRVSSSPPPTAPRNEHPTAATAAAAAAVVSGSGSGSGSDSDPGSALKDTVTDFCAAMGELTRRSQTVNQANAHGVACRCVLSAVVERYHLRFTSDTRWIVRYTKSLWTSAIPVERLLGTKLVTAMLMLVSTWAYRHNNKENPAELELLTSPLSLSSSPGEDFGIITVDPSPDGRSFSIEDVVLHLLCAIRDGEHQVSPDSL